MKKEIIKRLLWVVFPMREMIVFPLLCLWVKGLRRGWMVPRSSLYRLLRDLNGWFLGVIDLDYFDYGFWKFTGRSRAMGDFKHLVIAGASRRRSFDWLPECSPGIWRRAWLGAMLLVMRDRRDIRWMLASRKPGRFKEVLGCVVDSIGSGEVGGLLHRGLMWWLGLCGSRVGPHGKGSGKPENVMLGLIASTQDELDSGLHSLLECGAGGYWLHLVDIKDPMNLRLVGQAEGLEIDALSEGRISTVLFSGCCDSGALKSLIDQCNSAGIAFAMLDLDTVYVF